jgi:hypothetical protein
VAEDLDADQKRVGQLGPTGGPAKPGDLVGATENFINTVDQAVVSEEDEMTEGIVKEGQDDLDRILQIMKHRR